MSRQITSTTAALLFVLAFSYPIVDLPASGWQQACYLLLLWLAAVLGAAWLSPSFRRGNRSMSEHE